MITEKQRDAARVNGAKSRGPVTAEGKARSSKNATTHGLTAETVVLPCESHQRFHALLASMLETYEPSTDYEVSLVEKMAALNWQQDRLLGIDTVTLAIQMDIVEPALEAEVENLSTPTLIALAYRDLSDNSRVLSNLDRHASRIRRQFNQLRTELLALQKTRNEKLQNEPGGKQATGNEQHTNPEAVPRTSAPPSADSAMAAPVSTPVSTTPATDPAPQTRPEPEFESQPSSGRGLQSVPDVSASVPNQKLQNEPSGKQLPSNHPLASRETDPQVLAAQKASPPSDPPLETRTLFANETALAKARAALLRLKFS